MKFQYVTFFFKKCYAELALASLSQCSRQAHTGRLGDKGVNTWSILFRRDFRFAYYRLLSMVQALPASQHKEIKWSKAYAEWSLKNEPWRQQQILTRHTNVVSCLIPLADGRIVSGSWDKMVRIWSLNLDILTKRSI